MNGAMTYQLLFEWGMVKTTIDLTVYKFKNRKGFGQLFPHQTRNFYKLFF